MRATKLCNILCDSVHTTMRGWKMYAHVRRSAKIGRCIYTMEVLCSPWLSDIFLAVTAVLRDGTRSKVPR